MNTQVTENDTNETGTEEQVIDSQIEAGETDDGQDDEPGAQKSKFFLENGFERRAIFQCPDGTIWETQAAAAEHARGYLVKEALKALVGESENADQLVNWLYENKEGLATALDAAKKTRAPMTDAQKATATVRLTIARELGAIKALLKSPSTTEAARADLEVQLAAAEARLEALKGDPKADAKGDRSAVIANAS